MAITFIAPDTKEVLILGTFFIILQFAGIISQKIFKVETIGFLVIGVIYAPLAGLLKLEWQDSFLAVGYLGLIILVFEGALSTNTGLLTSSLSLSLVCAATGVAGPIGLSLLLLPAFGYTIIQASATGASLAATSLGTTVAVFKAGSTSPDSTWFSARVTTVLLSAATIDDVIGLVMASVMPSLGAGRDSSTIGWAIGRPILASVGLAIVTLIINKLIKLGGFKFLSMEWMPERYRARAIFVCMVASLTALASAAAYAGTSLLFGSFAAGIILSYTDKISRKAADQPDRAGRQPSATLSFQAVFQQTIRPVQDSVLAPLFFASIGFAIPFRDLWKATNVWHGIIYSILMLLGKLIVGLWIPVWSLLWWRDAMTPAGVPLGSNMKRPKNASREAVKAGVLLGSGMVARGEIGLLIVQLGYDSGNGPIPYDLYIVGIWALVLNTIVGPILVSFTLSHWRTLILKGPWGISRQYGDDGSVPSSEEQEIPRIDIHKEDKL